MSTSDDWNDYKTDESESDNGIEFELEEIDLGTPSDTDPTAMPAGVGIGHGRNVQQPHHMDNQVVKNSMALNFSEKILNFAKGPFIVFRP